MFSLADFLQTHQPKNGRFFAIAIDGRGCSGKSELLDYLQTLYPYFTCLHGDDYFRRSHDNITWGEFDEERFGREVITPLQKGDTFTHGYYDPAKMRWDKPAKRDVGRVFVLERDFAFALPLTWDLKIWVEAPAETCLQRGLRRNTHNLPPQRLRRAWQKWQQTEDEYIKNTLPQTRAQLVVQGTKDFGNQIA